MEMSKSEILQGCRLSVHVSKVRRRHGFAGHNDGFVSPSAKLKVTAGYAAENAQ